MAEVQEEGLVLYTCGEWQVRTMTVTRHGRGRPRVLTCYTLTHAPSEAYVTWVDRLPDAKEAVRWCAAEVPTMRVTGEVYDPPDAPARLRAIYDAVRDAKCYKRTVAAHRKALAAEAGRPA